jgi:hypothetical protein
MVKIDDGWRLLVSGAAITRICFGDEVGLQLYLESTYYNIQISSAFDFLLGGRVRRIDPSSVEGAVASELAGLRGSRIAELTATEPGSLLVTLANGGSLHVPADANVEGWEISSTDGDMLVPTPDGGIAAWTDDRESDN